MLNAFDFTENHFFCKINKLTILIKKKLTNKRNHQSKQRLSPRSSLSDALQLWQVVNEAISIRHQLSGPDFYFY